MRHLLPSIAYTYFCRRATADQAKKQEKAFPNVRMLLVDCDAAFQADAAKEL